MKALKNLTRDLRVLRKEDLRKINGGKRYCDANYPCPSGQCCIRGVCEIYCL